MEAAQLLAFNAALIAALVSPGPAMLFALRTTLARGQTAGVAAGFGLASAAATWTGLALLGVDRLFALFPFAYAAFKAAGALYLLWIACTTWRDAREPASVGSSSRDNAALGGALVNLANPKSVLFAAAVLVVIFPPGLGPGAMATIVLNHLILEASFYALFALLLSRPAVSRGYLRAKPALDRIAATVMGALGLRLLVER